MSSRNSRQLGEQPQNNGHGDHSRRDQSPNNGQPSGQRPEQPSEGQQLYSAPIPLQSVSTALTQSVAQRRARMEAAVEQSRDLLATNYPSAFEEYEALMAPLRQNVLPSHARRELQSRHLISDAIASLHGVHRRSEHDFTYPVNDNDLAQQTAHSWRNELARNVDWTDLDSVERAVRRGYCQPPPPYEPRADGQSTLDQGVGANAHVGRVGRTGDVRGGRSGLAPCPLVLPPRQPGIASEMPSAVIYGDVTTPRREARRQSSDVDSPPSYEESVSTSSSPVSPVSTSQHNDRSAANDYGEEELEPEQGMFGSPDYVPATPRVRSSFYYPDSPTNASSSSHRMSMPRSFTAPSAQMEREESHARSLFAAIHERRREQRRARRLAEEAEAQQATASSSRVTLDNSEPPNHPSRLDDVERRLDEEDEERSRNPFSSCLKRVFRHK